MTHSTEVGVERLVITAVAFAFALRIVHQFGDGHDDRVRYSNAHFANVCEK